jgi:hypothetical protein
MNRLVVSRRRLVTSVGNASKMALRDCGEITMKRITALVAPTLLLLAAPSLSFASMNIHQVSKERAKQLGMEIRLQGKGPNDVLVELEFRAEGELKDFEHVSLEIREGEKLLVGYAPLREMRSNSGSIVVRFLASGAYLDKITLRVVTGHPLNLTGHDLRVRDFLEPEKPPLKPVTP